MNHSVKNKIFLAGTIVYIRKPKKLTRQVQKNETKKLRLRFERTLVKKTEGTDGFDSQMEYFVRRKRSSSSNQSSVPNVNPVDRFRFGLEEEDIIGQNYDEIDDLKRLIEEEKKLGQPQVSRGDIPVAEVYPQTNIEDTLNHIPLRGDIGIANARAFATVNQP